MADFPEKSDNSDIEVQPNAERLSRNVKGHETDKQFRQVSLKIT